MDEDEKSEQTERSSKLKLVIHRFFFWMMEVKCYQHIEVKSHDTT